MNWLLNIFKRKELARIKELEAVCNTYENESKNFNLSLSEIRTRFDVILEENSNLYKRLKAVDFSDVPNKSEWLHQDMVTTKFFLSSPAGRKFVENIRHKLLEDHIKGVQGNGDAQKLCASLKGANNILSHLIDLGCEDSISSGSLVKEPNITAPDVSESGPLNLRT
jgi:hypothetical protein